MPDRLGSTLTVSNAIRAFAVSTMLAVAMVLPGAGAGPAAAQEHGGGSHGGGGGGSHGGDDGGHEGGEEDEGHDEGDHEDEGHKGGPGGGQSIWTPKGNRYGQGAGMSRSGSESAYGGRPGRSGVEELVFRRPGRGGRPSWAGGTLPEDIEIGRLNAGRAPGSVRQRALAEAYAEILDKNHDGIVDDDANLGAIESPVANLALYEEAIRDGTWSLETAARFLGQAAEKKLPISADTIFAVHTILELEDPESAFGSFSYDRAAAIDAETFAAVFSGQNASGSGVAGFAQAADDIRAIQQFSHDSHEGEAGS